MIPLGHNVAELILYQIQPKPPKHLMPKGDGLYARISSWAFLKRLLS